MLCLALCKSRKRCAVFPSWLFELIDLKWMVVSQCDVGLRVSVVKKSTKTDNSGLWVKQCDYGAACKTLKNDVTIGEGTTNHSISFHAKRCRPPPYPHNQRQTQHEYPKTAPGAERLVSQPSGLGFDLATFQQNVVWAAKTARDHHPNPQLADLHRVCAVRLTA